ncbi:MAG: carbon storage regulator [Pirellulales bacterium]
MLILSRKVGERIRIGDAIEVVVQRVCGERVTLGLAAPVNVKILRGELENFGDPLARQPVTVDGRNRAADHHAPTKDAALRRRLPR